MYIQWMVEMVTGGGHTCQEEPPCVQMPACLPQGGGEWKSVFEW